MKIKHTIVLMLSGVENPMIEREVNWSFTKEELKDPINQIGVMEWEKDHFLPEFIKVKREII